MVGQKTKKRIFLALNVTIHIILLFCIFLPFYFMLVSSFKNNAEISANYFGLPNPVRWDNYVQAFQKVIVYLMNSLIICLSSVVGVTVLACICAFVFAKYNFPGKSVLFYIYISFLMIPGVLTLIPQFTMIVDFGLMGTYWAAILPYIAFGQVMFAFVLRSFIEGIPNDLFDSARIDGANPFQTFFSVVFPLSKPIITSMALMNFLGNWNDFVWPLLVLRGEDMKTITVGLYAFTDAQQTQYGLLFAGFILASLPLMLLLGFNMKSFVQVMTTGAIKG